jgi:hypothetical protein
MIVINIDPEEEKELAREYIAMLVESKATSSTYIEPQSVISMEPKQETPELTSVVANIFTCSAHIRAEPN